MPEIASCQWFGRVLCGPFIAVVMCGAGLPPMDSNDDGFDELGVGIAGETVIGDFGAGGVSVFFGNHAQGVTIDGNLLFTQDTSGLADTADDNDHFGEVLAWGDFNADGFADLAIGVPFENVNDRAGAGAVQVLYGSASGLSASGSQLWTQDSAGITDDAEVQDFFGAALVTGQFNDDAYWDLAIGIPFEDLDQIADAGAVHVLYGSASGLRSFAGQLWTQNALNNLEISELNDQFGLSLAAGDFNGDGRDDLAIGAPFEDFPEAADTGAVHVIYAGAIMLTASGNQLFRQGESDILDFPSNNDLFGFTLAAGDFDGDGGDDLAVGVPFEDLGASRPSAGAVHIIYSAGSRLDDFRNQFWTQNSPGVPEKAEALDEFGFALGAGDINRDGIDDLVIGAPGESVGPIVGAGAIIAMYGTVDGLSADGSQLRHQGTPNIVDEPESGDGFGQAVSMGDFDGDHFVDVCVGVPFENIESLSNAGAVNVLFGRPGGLVTGGNLFISQDTPNVQGTAQVGDVFGGSRVNISD